MNTEGTTTETEYYTETATCEHGKVIDTPCRPCEEDLREGESLAPCNNCSGEWSTECNRKRTRCCEGCAHKLIVH